MKYYFYIVRQAGVKHQAVGALSGLNTKGTDDFDINDDIPIMAVVKRSEQIQRSHQQDSRRDSY